MMYRTLLALLLSAQLHAIVTIKPVDIGEKVNGFSGEFNAAYNITLGNTETTRSDIGGSLQYDNNASVSFVKVNTQKGEASKVENIDKTFVHGRLIIDTIKNLDSELFVQEYIDPFQKVALRTMLGGGVRTNIGDANKTGKLYLGAGAFYQAELDTSDAFSQFARGNFYFSYKLLYKKLMTFALVNYYQPRLDNFSDFLLLSTGQLEVHLNEKLSLVLSGSFAFDSAPVTGVKSYDITQKTAIKYSF